MLVGISMDLYAQPGFVVLPNSGDVPSAYVVCNPTGNYGLINAKTPEGGNDACSVTSAELMKSPLNAPLDGFRMIGMLVSDVVMPAPHAGEISAVAVLTDAIWRNKENSECILATHLQMNDAPLANGQYWEINDIARGGFAGKDVAIAYFYKPHSDQEGGNTEMLFRAGRTYTSVKTTLSDGQLPSTKNAPPVNVAVNENNAAAYSENWINFTTDLSFNDTDGFTRAISSIFYIKYACDERDPVAQPNAIHLRATGQSGLPLLDIAAKGLVPAGAVVDQY